MDAQVSQEESHMPTHRLVDLKVVSPSPESLCSGTTAVCSCGWTSDNLADDSTAEDAFDEHSAGQELRASS